MAKKLKDIKKKSKKAKKRIFVGLDEYGNPPEFSYVQTASSEIHNRGLFAAKRIPKDAYIIQYLGELIPKKESTRRGVAQHDAALESGDGSVYIFNLDGKCDLDGNFEWNIARLANHSCKPNCEAQDIDGEIWLVALQSIRKGEELTFDYGYDLEHWEEHPCLCGDSNCIGYIVGKACRKKLQKILKKRSSSGAR